MTMRQEFGPIQGLALFAVAVLGAITTEAMLHSGAELTDPAVLVAAGVTGTVFATLLSFVIRGRDDSDFVYSPGDTRI